MWKYDFYAYHGLYPTPQELLSDSYVICKLLKLLLVGNQSLFIFTCTLR